MLEVGIVKLLVIGFVALLLIGPERLPALAASLGRWTRMLKRMADDAKTRLGDELGPEFAEVEWSQLDPRRYSPKRIIREALSDGPEEPVRSFADPALQARPRTGEDTER